KIAKQSDHDCFCLVLPEADENEEKIAQLKSIPNRNEAERSELVARIGNKERNDGIHVKLCKAFRIVLQNPTFRESAGLRDGNPENTWEILVHLRRQLFRQIAFEDSKVVYVSTTATETHRLRSGSSRGAGDWDRNVRIYGDLAGDWDRNVRICGGVLLT